MMDDFHTPPPNDSSSKESKSKNSTEAHVEPLPESPSEEESFRDRWLRAVADAENLKKRLEKEKDEHVRYALTRFVKELLSVMDNLERALKSFPAEFKAQEGTKQFYQGVEMTHKEMSQVFSKFGIEKIEAMGKIFDPHCHQVILEQEAEGEPRTVLEVLQPGYKLHDRLLRPALVCVSKSPST